MSYQIGVDGGGTKTESVLIDLTGHVVARRTSVGCNPSVVGPERATALITAALEEIRAQAERHYREKHGHAAEMSSLINATLLCMAGHRSFWNELARDLRGFGRVKTTDDSLPVLELATGGKIGLVLHAGTGSFVAARDAKGNVYYAGGLGWRFGDPGSGYDLGQRAVARGLLERQGWAEPSLLRELVCRHAGLPLDTAATDVTRHYYQEAEPNRQIAALAPQVLQFAADGDRGSQEIVARSVGDLVDFAVGVASKIFPALSRSTLPAGMSGAILNHPAVREIIRARCPFRVVPITEAPIEGVRQLLLRENG